MLAIRAAHLFDGETLTAHPATILIDGGRIAGVESGYPGLGPEWQAEEYPDATLLPGLIDTHVHLMADSNAGVLDRVAGYSDTELEDVITDGLRRQLAAGVTTVRDLGDRRWNVVERRDRQRGLPRSGSELEPTILASGPPITSLGGHCHYLGGEVEGRQAIADAVGERAERGVCR